ncbi:MAG: hypothetical protein JWP61_80 [Friedmanniella sp.]|nr:hypothetical protein [Friedmanniella sp.]
MLTDHLPEDPHDELLERWNATLPHQEAMGEMLIRRYSEPHRRYHDARHLLFVLRMIDELADEQDLYLVRLGAWFHDSVYDVPERELTNEEASARLSVRELSRAGFEQEDLTQVARLVRLTSTHVPGARDPEGELLCDADLAILAAEPEAYARYVADVRAEYAAVPEEEFLEARLEIMSEIVEGQIYRTGKGRALVDAARANVEQEVASLTERLEASVAGSDG